jgi:hypothetical protein
VPRDQIIWGFKILYKPLQDKQGKNAQPTLVTKDMAKSLFDKVRACARACVRACVRCCGWRRREGEERAALLGCFFSWRALKAVTAAVHL